MKLIEFKDIKIGESFIAHGEKVELKSYRYDKKFVGYVKVKDTEEEKPIYSHDTVVEYIKSSGEIVVLVSQNPFPAKLELPEYERY